MSEIDETLKLVEETQSRKVFDITEYAKGRLAPQDTVTAYLDIESAYALNTLNDLLGNTPAGKEFDALEAQAKELSDKILKSKVVFHMRGVNQDIIEKVTTDANEKFPAVQNAFGVEQEQSPEWVKEWTCALIAANLIKVVNADGEEDERVFTAEDTKTMRSYLPREVWDLLVEKMQQLSLANAYFRGLTDAGFLPKS
jgi:hypothetical protein